MGLISTDVELKGDGLVDRIGGKGQGLVRLRGLGVAVPAFVVIEVEAYRASGRVPKALKEALPAALDYLGEGPFVVRSSAVAEDGSAHSFAGQLESFLGVDAAGLSRAIGKCWKSAHSERVQAYCAINGIEPGPVAVVIQRQITPDAAGVLFTANPSDPDRALISAAYGQCEGVVQGQVPCDTFHVGADDGIEAELDTKDSAIRVIDGQVVEVEVDPALRERPCLSDPHIRRLARIGRQLDAALQGPQDIEFCVQGNQIWIVQVRPITVRIPRGRKLLWDNSNIVESYSGVTTPMTFSFANRAYTIIYQLFCQVMGVRKSVIRENEPVFSRMIGLIRGRVFYNLNAWYTVLTLLPGYAFNRSAMEQMMGVAEVADDQDAREEDAAWQKALVHGPQLVFMIASLLWRLLWLERDIRSFNETFKTAYDAHRDRDLNQASPFELMDIYADLERRLLWAWTPPIVNDFFVMIAYGLLRKQCQAITGDEDTNLHNELLAGEGGLESTAPTIEALRMAARIRDDEALAAIFRSESTDAEVLAQALEHSGFKRNLDHYLRLYGDRCVDELKLETASLRDDPTFLISSLRNYLRGAPMDPDRFGESEQALRAKAEGVAFEGLTGLRAWAFRRVLNQTRTRVRERENLRFARTRIFGLVRDLVRAWGRHFVRAGMLDDVEDVFYLTVDEVQGTVQGTTVTTDLMGLVRVRRAEFDGYRAGTAPGERFHTRGVVHVDNPFTTQVSQALDLDGRLVGTGCCPGVVEGEAKVLADPRLGARLSGEILVAERTDPGWVPLYPTISGLLVERGSLLSHSAVVAREMGIPTIVGLRGLTAMVSDGDRLRMDGDAGTVEILSAGEE